jgi:uncharacterized membrane protein YebE (DUF533 family)
MKLGWLVILLVPVVLLFAWIGATHDARQQTVFLERTADRLEKTRAIPSETERRIQQTVESIRIRAARGDGRIDARKKRAIERIEGAFAARSLARSESVTGRISREAGGGSADERQQTARARR